MEKIIQILCNMEASDYIAISAVILAALSFLGQRKFNNRNEDLQKENNKISESIFQIDKQFKDYIKEKGEQKVLDFFTHFFIVQQNCWELSGKLKTDNHSLSQYIRELKQISKELETINEEKIYLLVKKDFPVLNILPSLLSDYISKLNSNNRLEINPSVYRIFYWSYSILLEKVDKQNSYFNKEWHDEILKISIFHKSEIEKFAGYELKKNIA